MKTTILLAVTALALACTGRNQPRAGAFDTILAGVAQGGGAGGPQETTELVLRRVLAGSGVDLLGAPTPDGRYLTFTDWSTGDLAVRDMSNGEVRHLTDDGGTTGGFTDGSIVSPDGSRVAFSWYPDGWTAELRIMRLDGTGMSIPFHRDPEDEAYAWPYAWSPDGRTIALSLTEKNKRSIALMSAEDGSLQVVRQVDVRYPAEISFSPDGQFLVYDLEVDPESAQRDIFLRSLNGDRETRLVEDPADDFLLGWVPGTDYILFSSDRLGTPGAWVLRIENGRPAGEPVLVKSDLWRADPMGFNADGDFFYGVAVGSRSIHTATLDVEGGEVLSPPAPVDRLLTGAMFWPTWSPDGRYLAWVKQNMNLRYSVMVRSRETGELREIHPRYLRGSVPRWSPDGSHWLETGMDGDHRNLLAQIDVRTGQTELLRTFQGETTCCNWYDWSPDGKTVYYKGDDGTESWLAAFDLETGSERILYKVDEPSWITNWADLSPAGTELAFWLREGQPPGPRTGRLLVIPTAAREGRAEPRELRRFQSDANPTDVDVGYTPDGRYILFIRREDDGIGRIWRIPAAGGEAKPLGFARRMLGKLPDFHPDGRTLAFAEGQGRNEVWVMENYLPGR